MLSIQVDAGFDNIDSYKNTADLGITFVNVDDPILSCAIDGVSIMMRKDTEMWKWWDPALESLMATTTYRTICKDLLDTHGMFNMVLMFNIISLFHVKHVYSIQILTATRGTVKICPR